MSMLLRRPRWLNLDSVATAVIALSLAALVVITIVFALLAPAYVTHHVDQVQLEVTCQAARSNRDQLQALRAIAHEIGIPITFEVPPPLPPECGDP